MQPQDLVLGAALGQEADRRVLGRRGAHQVGVAAAFAGGELERGRVAVGAVLVAGEPDVRPLPGQAGERALGGAGEQVVARGEQRVAVGVAHPAAQGDQGGQRGGGPHGAVVLSGEDPHGQVLQRLRAAVGEQGAQFPHALFGGEHPVGVAVGDAVPPGGGDELGPGVGGAADRRVVGGRQRPPRPARGVGAAGGGHQVLPVGVGRVPLERRVEEQPGRERHHRLRVVADGGAGGDALQAAAGGDPVAQAAQQHRQFGGLGPVVDVRLVQGDEPPVPGVLALEQVEVGGAQQQVLQHRVVGEQQVRRPAPHLLAADELVGQRVALAVQAVVGVEGLPVAVLGLAGVAAEGDVRAAGEQFPQPFELVVGERVHRVQQQRAHARPELAAPVLLLQLVEDGQQEALGLARPGAGGHHQVASGAGLADRLLLVQVEGAVQVDRGAAGRGEGGRQHAFGDQLARGGAGPVGRGGLQQRPLGQQRAAADLLLQGVGESAVAQRQQGAQVAAVAVTDQGADADGVQGGGHAVGSLNSRARSVPARVSSARTRSTAARSGAAAASSAHSCR